VTTTTTPAPPTSSAPISPSETPNPPLITGSIEG
jgi:hypothetical protein